MSSDFVMDTLSKTLLKLRLKTLDAGALDAAGEWAIDVPGFEGFRLYLYLKGECWISVAGETWRPIKAGDCVLIAGESPFVIAKNPFVKKSLKWENVVNEHQEGRVTINGGGDIFSIGSYFQFEGHLPKILFSRLPPAIFISGDANQTAFLHWTLERFKSEFFSKDLGRLFIMSHLAPILLTEILRTYLASAKNEKNWLLALSDPKLSKAIEAMHSDYRRGWSLEDLAKAAGMSRSRFALLFKTQLGISPMDYLTSWRMQIACELLEAGDKNIAAVAHAVGYESESAFSVAFKKVVNCRPGYYQKTLRAKTGI